MPDALTIPARLRPRTLTAAATTYTPTEYRAGGVWHTQSWQVEAWGFYDTLGEFAEAIDWQARAMSRIHLNAAEITPEGPQVLTDHPAADLMAGFCGGTPGHADFLARITPLLKIPGEGWLIAERADERQPLVTADWCVYSTDCVDVRGSGYWVQVGDTVWRPLLPDALPMRIFQPHPRRPWLATSSAEAAVPIMRRIDLIDRRIIAMMVSRLAMNGLLLIPDEGTFSVPPQYQDAPDPFVAMLIDIASKNIAEPGRASAGIPIPVKFTSELIEKWRILKAEDPLDEWLLKERTDELGRLGDALSISRERVTGGVGELNHWNAWQVSEEEIRITFAPTAELICGAVTKSYLEPALRELGLPLTGPNGGKLVAWYDASELAARPDLSASALNLWDRGELSGSALRRESGFNESDAPDPAELAAWVWRQALKDPNLAAQAVQQLVGVAVAVAQSPVAGAPAPSGPGPVPSEGAPAAPATGAPPTLASPPPAPGTTASSRVLVAAAPARTSTPSPNGNGHH
jgi:hypothetical protein